MKIWGTARVVENDAVLVARLMPKDYNAKPEQTIVFHVDAWDANCPRHIPLRFEAREVAKMLELRDARIRELEAELWSLRET